MKRRFFTPTSWVYVLAHALLILLGYHLATSSNPSTQPIRLGIGSSLIAAGVTGWVVFVYMLVSEKVSEQVRIVTDFGLISAFAGRSVFIKQEYDRRLDHAGTAVDIMGFGLKSLRQDYRNDFKRWSRRANIRILMLDPTFPTSEFTYSSQRDREELDEPGSIEADVSRFLDEILPLTENTGNHTFQIRLYKCLPSVNIFRIDRDMFWGPYLIHQPSRSSPTFIAREGGTLFRVLSSHFDEIWKDNNLSISASDYLAARNAAAQ